MSKKNVIKPEQTEMKYILEIAVFICGAVVMAFELTGSRIVAPYLGTSIYVWSSLIGVILGSLSFGYWYGGKLADKKPAYSSLSIIIFIAAILLGFTTLIKDNLIDFLMTILNKTSVNFQWSSLIIIIIIFTLPSILLGMVSPYAVKLKIHDIKSSGRTVGNLFAISTLGSIAGTFLTGFLLIPLVGSTKILFILTITLFIISIFLYIRKHLIPKMILIFVVLILNLVPKEKNYIDIDTMYNRVWVHNAKDIKSGKKLKVMRIGYTNSSSMFQHNDELVIEYTKYYSLIKHLNPDFTSSLMIGGAAYSYPKYYLKKFPGKLLDVVEIDPELTVLAKKYFRLKDNPRLKIFHEDGRMFLNRTQKKYDAYLCDVLSSNYSFPFQLTTLESVQKMYNILNNNGVAIANIISSIEGEKGKFLRAEYATYKKVFPQVYLFPVSYPDNGEMLQNVMIVALKSDTIPSFESNDAELDKFLQHKWSKSVTEDMPVLTDDHAPVDYYISNLL